MLSTRQMGCIIAVVVLLAADTMAGAADNTAVMNIGKTVSIDPRSGAPALNIPLKIPAGRGNIGPSLALSYSPTNGNGILGWGWAMDLGGSIMRSTKKGVPAYDSTDEFIAQVGGKSFDLVAVGGGIYRARLEEDYMTFTFANGVWQARDRRATTYFFASRPGSTVTDGTRVFKWKLDRVQDLFGNVMVVDHKADGAFEIRYSLAAGKNPDTDVNDPNNFAYRIVGDIEPVNRTDVITGYRTGFAATERRRLKSVSIYGGGQLMRKYIFNYHASPRTARSELVTLVEYGIGGETVIRNVGDIFNFGYNDSASPAYTVKSLKNTQAGDNLWNCQFGGGYDRGHDNYGPVPGFDVDMGPIYTQVSGSATGVNWSINSQGRLRFSSGQDTACQCWTYAYVPNDKTISIAGAGGGEWGVYLNGSTTVNKSSIGLKAGYNLIVLTNYHQHESFTFDLGFDLASQVGIMNSSIKMNPQITGDFDGDGVADVATYSADTGSISVMRVKGAAYTPATTWISGFATGSQKLLLGDINGDGRVDVVSYNATTDELRVAYSDGLRFNLSQSIVKLGKTGDVALADMDGDGYSDIYVLSKTSIGKELWLAKNKKDGTFSMATSSVPLYVGGPEDMVLAADVNGDGLTDLVGFNKAAGKWSIHLNTNGFNNSKYYSLTGFGAGQSGIMADFDDDGRSDIGYYDLASKKVIYRPSRDGGFATQVERTFGFTMTDPSSQLQVADFNGDGLADYAVFTASGIMDVAYSSGPAQDVLKGFNNNSGGFVKLGYISSTQFINKYLPFVMPVVNTVYVGNGVGDVYKTTYSYSGGYWNVAEREFYGFETAKTFDQAGNYTLTQFDQSNLYLRGKVKRTAVYGASGKLYQETINQWNLIPVLSGRSDVQFPALIRTDKLVYDTSVTTLTGIRRASEFSYDVSFGLPLEGKDYGQVDFVSGLDIGNDLVRMVNTYTGNGSVGISGLPVSAFTYDSAGNVLGKEWVYYDGSTTLGAATKGLPTKRVVWNKAGTTESTVSTEKTYSAYGMVLTSKDALGAVTTFNYDTVWAMFLMSVTDPKGFVTKHEYYGVNGVTLTSTYPGTTIMDSMPQPCITTSPANLSPEQMMSILSCSPIMPPPDGVCLPVPQPFPPIFSNNQLTNPWGYARASVDINNQRSSVMYDSLGRTLAEVGPLDSEAVPTTTYGYINMPSHREVLTRRLLEHGQVKTLDSVTYVDGLGRRLYTKSPSEIAGQYVVTGQVRFNSQGLVQKEFVPYLSSRPFLADFRVADHFSAPAASSDNYATCGTLDSAVKGSVYDYDELGRMVKATGADGAYVSYVYTLSTDTVIDANGHKKVSVKDARGRVARVEEYSGADGRSKQYPATAFSLYAATTYEYDIKGNITRVLDASGNATTMSYDALGRKTDMSSPDMGLMRYAYDAAGQLTVQTDAQNMTTALVYDALGRLSSKASGGVSGANVAYTYDSGTLGVGRLSKVAYPSGSTAFGYDSVGAEIASTKTIDAKSYAVNKTYDALGRLKQIQYPDGKSTAIYQYNETGLLNSLQLKVTSGTTSTIQNIVTNVDYTPNGSVARIDYGNGAVALYTYNADNLRLAGLSVTGKTGAILQKNLYSYDAGGNIQQIQDAARGKTQTFQYDFLDRLIGSNDGSGALAYAYDQLGNIVQKGNITYTYGENGSGAHAVTSLSDGTRMTYDASGNMTSYRTAARTQYYSFDAYGRLTKVEAVNTGETARYTVAEYAYDGDGGRTKKTVYSSGNATTTYFVGALFDEVNGVKTDHLFIGGARVAAYDGSRVRWFIGDHLASTSTVLDETSALTERIDYTPWGEVKNYEKYGNTPEVAWFYFTGKKLDEESGLVYFGARYYNPKLGRFITADPIVQAPYNPQTLNRYTYCNNNPINLVDPTGRSWKSFFKAITDTVKYVINPVKWDPLINGVVTGDWSYAKQMVIAGTTGFIFGGPIGAATAMFTTAVMRTPIAQWTIENYGHYYFDNVLGMRPGTAYVWSYLTISTGVSLGTEAMLASSGGAQPAQKRKLTPDEKEYLRQNGNFAGDENRYGSSLKTKAFDGPDDNVWGLSLKDGLRASYQDTPLTVPGLQQMGALHSSANVIGIQAQTINPWSYAFWGTCHQATNVSLLQGGISYTLMDLSGNWSMAVTTAVYGNYGGQLPSRIYSGVQAYNDYDES